MEYLREKVSGNKRRFVEGEYNLDLSYITPKVIAMAFPGEGIRKLYRNSIDSVKNFLTERHGTKSLVINISGEKYSYDVFDNNVLEYDWIDHQAPKICTLFKICEKMYEFCSKDNDNVVAVNCRAGKGRTGTVICCFLLFCGLFQDPKDALDYYSIKRFKSGEGVTQPSQKRYVYFFYELLNKIIYYPLKVTLTGIYLFKIPKLEEKDFIKLFFNLNLENSDKVTFTSKLSNSDQRKIYADKNNYVKISENDFNYTLTGDFTISIFENLSMSDKLLGRISYNTAFMKPEGGYLNFKLEQIDPDNLIKKKNYDKAFTISLKYKSCCSMMPKELSSYHSNNRDSEICSQEIEYNKLHHEDINYIKIETDSNKQNKSEVKEKKNKDSSNKNAFLSIDETDNNDITKQTDTNNDDKIDTYNQKENKNSQNTHDNEECNMQREKPSISKYTMNKSNDILQSTLNNKTEDYNFIKTLYKDTSYKAEMCDDCKEFLNKHNKIEEWDQIRKTISDFYLKDNPIKVLFGKEASDVVETLKEKVKTKNDINFEEEPKNVSMQGRCSIY